MVENKDNINPVKNGNILYTNIYKSQISIENFHNQLASPAYIKDLMDFIDRFSIYIVGTYLL